MLDGDLKYSTERLLCEKHARKYCYLVGNGTTALYLGIKVLGINNGSIAIPNNVCPNVVMAVYFSGNTPVYIELKKVHKGCQLKN